MARLNLIWSFLQILAMCVVVVFDEVGVVFLKGVEFEVFGGVAGAGAPGQVVHGHFPGGFPDGEPDLAASLAVGIVLVVLDLFKRDVGAVVAYDAGLIDEDGDSHHGTEDQQTDERMVSANGEIE